MIRKQIEYSGRKYMAYVSPDDPQGAYIVIGPPENLVDEMGYKDPFATMFHNILFDRGLYTYEDVVKNPNVLQGAVREAFMTETQRLQEAYFKYQQESGGSL